jgi:hypothetical protein
MARKWLRGWLVVTGLTLVLPQLAAADTIVDLVAQISADEIRPHEFVAFADEELGFRNPNYHRATDTIETLDFAFATHVTQAALATTLNAAGLGSDALPTPTHTPLRATPTATPTSPPGTSTPTRTPSPTVTATAPTEPLITFFGVARADDVLVDAIGSTGDGVPVYLRLAGSGFSLVVEGRPGTLGARVGTSSFSSNDVNQLPDLQVEVSRPLGDGSIAVCDDTRPDFGGVPAVTPFDFSTAEAQAINDFACRFKDGQGHPIGRERSDDACTRFLPGDEYHFVDPASRVQFCGFIDKPLSFWSGDTRVAARIRDTAGNVSAVAQLVIRIATPPATATATEAATPTAIRTKAGGPPANFADSDGCTIASGVHGSWSGLLVAFLPLILMRWRGRRGVRTRRR